MTRNTRRLLFVLGLLDVPFIGAQSTPVTKFEVASVKLCKAEAVAPGGRSGGGNFSTTPGRARVQCMNLEQLIYLAYAGYGARNNPLLNDSGPSDTSRIRGGPAWVRSDRYTIDAEAAGTPEAAVMMGPMLQALLEDRFRLKTHREAEEIPMYALTVAKGGFKLQALQEGGCAPRVNIPLPEAIAAVRRGEKPMCGTTMLGNNGPNATADLGGMSLNSFANGFLSRMMDRHVIDQTGIAGTFNIHLEYASDENTPGAGRFPGDAAADPTGGPSIVTALQEQLGLKLEPVKGPHGFIVIDRAERPSEN